MPLDSYYAHRKGQRITTGRGKQLRVVAIDDFPHAELVEQDVRAIFTVEPV